MNALLTKLKSLFGQLFTIENDPTPEGPKIYQYCLTLLGKDASPRDLAPDMEGCAETVTTIFNFLYPDVPVITGTYSEYMFLEGSQYFVEVSVPLPGDIGVAPTGLGNGVIPGHTGVKGEKDVIMSNNSYTGNFEANYTMQTWEARYGKIGGFKTHWFRRIFP